MAHYNGNIPHLFPSRLIYFCLAQAHVVLLCSQAAQLAYIMDKRLKEATEDVDWDRAPKDIAVAMANEKGEAVAVVKQKAKDSEKARALAEKRLTKLDVKLGDTELKLAEAESLNLAQADEIVDLKVALEACKDQ